MPDPLELRYTVTAALWHQAMNSWHPPFDPKKRTWPLRVTGPLLAAGLLSGVLAASGLYDALGTQVLAGFVPGVLVGLFVMLSFWKRHTANMAAHATSLVERQGETRVLLDGQGIRLENRLGDTFLRWAALDQVIVMPGGSALRFGAMLHPVPDAALPGGLNAAAFRERLNQWWQG